MTFEEFYEKEIASVREGFYPSMRDMLRQTWDYAKKDVKEEERQRQLDEPS